MGMRGPAQADKANVYIDVTRLDNKWFDSLSLSFSLSLCLSLSFCNYIGL